MVFFSVPDEPSSPLFVERGQAMGDLEECFFVIALQPAN